MRDVAQVALREDTMGLACVCDGLAITDRIAYACAIKQSGVLAVSGERAGGGKVTLAVAMIVRDEAAVLARCLDSIQGAADEIVVVDTGSTDGTREIAARYTDAIYDFAWCDDFAAARQFAFDRATSDWVMWFDADDVALHADRLVPLLACAPAEVSGYYLPYVLSWDARGNPTFTYWRERCVRNDGTAHWEGRIHESLVSEPGRRIERCAEVVIEHRPDPERAAKKQGRNLAILQEEVAERGEDVAPRTLFYLGREYRDNGDLPAAIATLERYVAVSTWDDERYLAQTMIADLYRVQGRYAEAIEADLRALTTFVHWPDAYFGLAETYYYLHEWPKVVHWCDVGRALPPPDTLLFIDPTDYTHNWIIHYTVALSHLGRTADALAWTERALAHDPENSWHKENRALFTSLLAGEGRQATALAASPSLAEMDDPFPPCALPVPGVGGRPVALSPPGPLKLIAITLADEDGGPIAAALRGVVEWVDTCLVIHRGAPDEVLGEARAVAGEKYIERSFPGTDDAAAARNFALDIAVMCGAGWAVMVDADERIDPRGQDMRAVLEHATEDVLAVLHESGTYAKDRYFRLPARGRFVGPVREYYTAGGARAGIAPAARFTVAPKSPEHTERQSAREMTILREYAARYPQEGRWFYHLGDLCHTLGHFDEAIAAFETCASLDGWDEERAWACYRAAECWIALGYLDRAVASCAAGMARHPGLAELPWLAGFACWRAGQLAHAIIWSHLAIALGKFRGRGGAVRRGGFCNPHALYEGPYDVLRFALRAVGDHERAEEAERLYRHAMATRHADEE